MKYICFVYSIAENTIHVTTPPVNETTTRRMPIILETVDGALVDTNRTFEYYDNPVFTDVRPRNHLAA